MKYLVVVVGTIVCSVAAEEEKFEEQITRVKGAFHQPALRLRDGDILTTRASYRAPVEFLIKAKTDHRNLRLRYAGAQVIFNWEVNEEHFRVDGGPADGEHVKGRGGIPKGEYVTIRWIVAPTFQKILVDDELRFEHKGDYSKVKEPLSVYTIGKSEVRVKSIKVRKFNEAPRELDPGNIDKENRKKHLKPREDGAPPEIALRISAEQGGELEWSAAKVEKIDSD